MPRALLISVRFHDGRYHGSGEWPPSPARLFQALVAGAAQGEMLAEEDRHALEWLESLEAPIIVTPPMRAGRGFKNFVPNNDRDAVESREFKSHRDYLAALGKIRTSKDIRPILFDAETPLLYVWTFGAEAEASTPAQRICAIAERFYQLGRGVDMAWAWGEILGNIEAEARIAAHGGAFHQPRGRADGATLAVPLKGSLESLIERHKKARERFRTRYESKPDKKGSTRKVATGQILVQPPKPRFRQVAYDSPPARPLFDLVGESAPWPLARIVELTEHVRDAAMQKLSEKLPQEANKIHSVIVGRQDADTADKAARIRITPLPSIGHQYADHAIRRILVEIPPNCPLRADDVEWTFSGLEAIKAKVDAETGEVRDQLILAPPIERSMLSRYGVEDAAPACLWRTVTPAALPQQAARRRIDPARRREEAKGGAERAKEEGKAVSAVIQALRHADISARPLTIRVQREPFEAKGARAEAFAPRTRFAKERLWHVEIAFANALGGPLVIGDGRYLGLGLMAPVQDAWRDLIVFSLPTDARVAFANRADLLRAVRRALMALSRDDKGNVPLLFSGHEPDGAPASSGRHRHVFLACADLDGDGRIEQLIVAAPWACDHSVRPGRGERAEFDRVTASLNTVRAGRLGVIPLQISSADQGLNGPARTWESHTNYRPARHAGRGKEPAASLLRDVAAECERRGLPKPEVELLDLSVSPKDGIAARLRLRFAVAVAGPILLGRDSHKGGGLFAATTDDRRPT